MQIKAALRNKALQVDCIQNVKVAFNENILNWNYLTDFEIQLIDKYASWI